jgi:hypothetical protein
VLFQVGVPGKRFSATAERGSVFHRVLSHPQASVNMTLITTMPRVSDCDIWAIDFTTLEGKRVIVTEKYDGCQLQWTSVDGKLVSVTTHNDALIAKRKDGKWIVAQPKFNGADIPAILAKYTADVEKNLKKIGTDATLYCELIHPKAGNLLKMTYPKHLHNTCIFFDALGAHSTRPGFTPDLFEDLPVPEIIYNGTITEQSMNLIADYLIANHKTVEGVVFAFEDGKGCKLRTAVTESAKNYLKHDESNHPLVVSLRRMREETTSKAKQHEIWLSKAASHGMIDIAGWKIATAKADAALMQSAELALMEIAMKEGATKEDGDLQSWAKKYIGSLTPKNLVKRFS